MKPIYEPKGAAVKKAISPTNKTDSTMLNTCHSTMYELGEKIEWPSMSCPETGEFTAYKKAYGKNWEDVIITLTVPADALRCSAWGTKCRCNKARVDRIQTLDGKDRKKARSKISPLFMYKVGKIIQVRDYDKCRWNECAPGIHFFMTRKEAIEWDI